MGILGGERIFYGRVEALIEVAQNSCPLLFSLGYLVKLFFNTGGKVIVKDIGKIFHQEVIDYGTRIGRHQFSFLGSCYFCLGNVCNLAVL